MRDEDYWFHYVLHEDPENIKKIIEEQFIFSNDIKIHLDIYDGTQPMKGSIIFIHGTSVYGRFYAEFCYRLYKEGFRVIAPDLIGHGLSGGMRGHFTMKRFSETIQDVIKFIIEKYGEKPILMGSSLGGIATLYGTAFNDDLLLGAICHNAAIFNEKAYKRILHLSGILKILVHLIPLMAKVFPTMKLSVFTYLDFEKLAGSEFREKIDFLLDDPLLTDKYTLTSLNAQLKEPLSKPVEEIRTAIMIINGENDFLFSIDYMHELFERLTCDQKKLIILEGASHLIFQESINEVLKNIIPWIETKL